MCIRDRFKNVDSKATQDLSAYDISIETLEIYAQYDDVKGVYPWEEMCIRDRHEPERRAQTKSYMWLFRSGEDGGIPIILYKYSETRAGDNACLLYTSIPAFGSFGVSLSSTRTHGVTFLPGCLQNKRGALI